MGRTEVSETLSLNTIWELHGHNYIPSEVCENLPVLDLEAETKKATKEFFQEANQKALTEAHSVKIDNNLLLYDYIGTFEDSEIRIPKVIEFLANLQLGKQGSKAKDEFYADLEWIDDEDLAGEDNNQDDIREDMDEETL